MIPVNDIRKFLNSLPPGIKLVAVSKTHTCGEIMEIYQAGHKIFGENRVQELTYKYQQLPKDIEWHMVGHLQTNKVKYIAPFVHMIHSVDSMKLLMMINKEAAKLNRIIDCLLEIHIAGEISKFGLNREECKMFVRSDELKDLHNIRLTGLMGMASFTEDEQLIRSEFRDLRQMFDEIKNLDCQPQVQFTCLSMGMSGDYKIALEEGSTMIRVGTLIFGERIISAE
jgi:pyridoxal phosphate enzyme (YggS family)